MLLQSQPLNPELSKKFEASNKEIEAMTEQNISSQYIGELFDDIFDRVRTKKKASLKTRLDGKKRLFNDGFYDLKRTIRNHMKWHVAMEKLYPWAGFSGMIRVMQTHLYHYVLYEKKFGHSTDEWRAYKIKTAKETIKLLNRIKKPDEYLNRRREEIKTKYPKYQSLITKYKNGGSGSSGDFIAQGNGWVGMEAGKDPREGYFEFINGRFELANSPNQCETDRLLSELRQYHKELDASYKKAETDSDRDFERLLQLLKENMYSWWD